MNPGGNYYRPSFFGGFSFFPPVIKWLLICNAAIWLLTDVFLARFQVGGMLIGGDSGIISYLFALWPIGTNFWPWQLFTYMFMHGGFGHLLFNMIALWMFGMELENIWGSTRFLMYYLACGLGGGIANLLWGLIISQGLPTVGASGAVFGVLVAFGMLFPDRPIYIYFLLPIKAKYFVSAYILLELFYGVSGTTSGVAHFAHLGGAAVGVLYVIGMMRGFDPLQYWNKLKSSQPLPSQQRRARQPVPDEVHDAKFFDISSGRQMDDVHELNQEVVDAILDKINTSGYQSLTEEEKRILNEASKKIN